MSNRSDRSRTTAFHEIFIRSIIGPTSLLAANGPIDAAVSASEIVPITSRSILLPSSSENYFRRAPRAHLRREIGACRVSRIRAPSATPVQTAAKSNESVCISRVRNRRRNCVLPAGTPRHYHRPSLFRSIISTLDVPREEEMRLSRDRINLRIIDWQGFLTPFPWPVCFSLSLSLVGAPPTTTCSEIASLRPSGILKLRDSTQ